MDKTNRQLERSAASGDVEAACKANYQLWRSGHRNFSIPVRFLLETFLAGQPKGLELVESSAGQPRVCLKWALNRDIRAIRPDMPTPTAERYKSLWYCIVTGEVIKKEARRTGIPTSYVHDEIVVRNPCGEIPFSRPLSIISPEWRDRIMRTCAKLPVEQWDVLDMFSQAIPSESSKGHDQTSKDQPDG